MAPSSDEVHYSNDTGSRDGDRVGSRGGPAREPDDDGGIRSKVRIIFGAISEDPVAILGMMAFASILPVAVLVRMGTLYPQGVVVAIVALIALAAVLNRRAPVSDFIWKLWLASILYLWLLPFWVATAEYGQFPGPVTTFFITFIPFVYTFWVIRSV